MGLQASNYIMVHFVGQIELKVTGPLWMKMVKRITKASEVAFMQQIGFGAFPVHYTTVH